MRSYSIILAACASKLYHSRQFDIFIYILAKIITFQFCLNINFLAKIQNILLNRKLHSWFLLDFVIMMLYRSQPLLWVVDTSVSMFSRSDSQNNILLSWRFFLQIFNMNPRMTFIWAPMFSLSTEFQCFLLLLFYVYVRVASVWKKKCFMLHTHSPKDIIMTVNFGASPRSI